MEYKLLFYWLQFGAVLNCNCVMDVKVLQDSDVNFPGYAFTFILQSS